MVGEKKRHQMMQNLFGDQSEEEDEEDEEEVESEHESNRQPDYASDEGDVGVKPEGEDVVEGQGEAEVGSDADGELHEMDQEHIESEGERDQSSQEVDLGDQRDESEGKDSGSDQIGQRVVTSRRREAVESESERSEDNHYLDNAEEEIDEARSQSRSPEEEKDDAHISETSPELRDVFGESDDEEPAEYNAVQNSGAKPTPSSVNRLWRPAAQRNMKNQWSRLNSLRQEWFSSYSAARSHATSLVNAYLSQRYMKDMELGVLSDMPDIQKKACCKLLKQQVIHRDKLLSSYKDMVATVFNMVNTSSSLRCFFRGGTNSSHIRFSCNSEDTNDDGDGGGMPVYTFWSISSFEKLASEMVQMFKSELYLKRLLVMEFLSLKNKDVSIIERLCWSDEIYQGEFDDLSKCNLDHREASESVSPKLDRCISETLMKPNHQPDSDVLQIYLTVWLTDVNIDKQRMEDIFSEVGEEMHTNFLP